ncbi:MAG TPA: M15 family metallopeptidase [Acidimicrobiales bacterium]|nr:M15 family metallopeptidase [Acidimicrobiales bacterium]
MDTQRSATRARRAGRASGHTRAAAVVAAAMAGLALEVGGAPPAGAATSPITPGNTPTPIAGATNGELPATDLVRVAPGCLADRAAAPSLGLLLAEARQRGVALGTEECYRPLAGQLAEQSSWTAAGNSACAAPVATTTTGTPVGTSMHGWGKAADFSDAGGTVAFGSPGYQFLTAYAGQVGWNHPGWAQPGGSACPEAWHWEWVGDGGTAGASPIRADVVGLLSSPDGGGYASVSGLGTLVTRGDAHSAGDLAAVPITGLVVGAADAPGGAGYWMASADGGVFSFGGAAFHGSAGGLALAAPIVGMAATPDGGGYWLVAADGGVFSFGDAAFHGSTGAMHLNAPIVGMAATPDGGGYWLVAADGGVFSFGDAAFHGSTGALHLDQPVVGMAATADGAGYRMVAADGGVFDFGDATFLGSGATTTKAEPVVAMTLTPSGAGYWLTSADGAVLAFGDAGSYGGA